MNTKLTDTLKNTFFKLLSQSSVSNKRKGEGAQGMCFYHCNIKKAEIQKDIQRGQESF